ncbi:14_t:CDS:2, partial [Diversispora eburnea]
GTYFSVYYPQNYGKQIIKCFGVTLEPKTKNYAFILEAREGDLYHFACKKFDEFTWKKKIKCLCDIVKGIKEIHDKNIIHRDLHSGNILLNEFVDHSLNTFGYAHKIKQYHPKQYKIWFGAEKKRLEMIRSKKPFVKKPGYEHPNSRYYSTSLNSMLESFNSTISGQVFLIISS